MQKTRRAVAPMVAWLVAMVAGGAAIAAETIQIPVDSVLNTRSVTTLTGGALVTWIMGVDGGGTADGYLTSAASKFHNDPPAIKALPDDGRFPADDRHPDIVLHFSNDASAASQQTRFVKGAGEFSFATPAAQYQKLFLFLTSAEGASMLRIVLTYADGTTDVTNQSLPDYYNPIPAGDPVFFNLALNLAKWNKQNTIAETNHHFIDGVELHPTGARVLTDVTVTKGAAGYLVFWGATGVATSSPDGGGAVDASPALDAGPSTGGDAAPADLGGTGGQGGATPDAGGGGAGAGGAAAGGAGGGTGGS
ncbi:MAG TPA: hypothetical protein VNO55_13600, partial [Polyangia bacterium]|nr:hypothetical protein [Polyangia bacterium]